MANFWDLPRNIRDKIYRLHLIKKYHITEAKLRKICTKSEQEKQGKKVPPLLQLSSRADREAAPIFFGENHFEVESMAIGALTYWLWPRHVYLIRQLTCDWDPYASGVSYGLAEIRRMKGLQELNMKVDEAEMIEKSVSKSDRYVRQRFPNFSTGDVTPQEALTIFHFPAFGTLMSLSGIGTVNFMKRKRRWERDEHGGPLKNGALLTYVLPKITAVPSSNAEVMSKKNKKKARGGRSMPKQSHFDFLGLPPELRNRIYDMLFYIPGPVHPSKKLPSSAPKNPRDEQRAAIPQSALSVLLACKQIYDEAVGVFYANTPFIFYYSTQFQAFILSLGPDRLKSLADITLEYDSSSVGGIALVDLAYPALKQLANLRRLRIVMSNQLYEKMRRKHWGGRITWDVEKANPGLMPGMASLFELRGVTDILVQDLELEKEHSKMVNDSQYPDFPGDAKKQSTATLFKVLAHFNAALSDAQHGKVNKVLLEDNQWQLMDEFPVLEVEEDPEEDPETESEQLEQPSSEELSPEEDDYPEQESASALVLTSDVELPPEAPAGPRRSARIASKALSDNEFFQQADLEDERDPEDGLVEDQDSEKATSPVDGSEDEEIGEEIVVRRRGASPELGDENFRAR